MYKDDDFNPIAPNDYELTPQEEMIQESKNIDKGYTFVYRKVLDKRDVYKKRKIEIYTTSGVGNYIRDAETGEYYNNKVGSKDEDLFLKVALSTGECKSKNGSNVLFYLSPQQYSNHFHVQLDDSFISSWEEKRRQRLKTRNDKIVK
jgi:hypothetical protein